MKQIINETKSMPCEVALQRYFATFDGNKKEFSEVEHLFDDLYHEDFQLDFQSFTLTREVAKRAHASYMSRCAQVTLIHFRRIGLDLVDVKFHINNREEEEDFIIHMMYTIRDDKLLKSYELMGCPYPTYKTSDKHVTFKQPLCTIREYSKPICDMGNDGDNVDDDDLDLNSRHYSTCLEGIA